MKEIDKMTIRAQDGTCVVLTARERWKPPVENTTSAIPQTNMIKICRVEVIYKDGSRYVFYFGEDNLINFLRDSINEQKFRTTTGEIAEDI